MNPAQKVKYLLEHNRYMTIATADASGNPWVSPVFFAYDNDINLYWISAKDTLHSKNIRHRPQVSVSVLGQLPDSSMDGVYIVAKAMELESETSINKGIAAIKQRQQTSKFTVHSIDDVTGAKIWRMYQAVPIEISKRVDKLVKGQAVTARERVELVSLQN